MLAVASALARKFTACNYPLDHDGSRMPQWSPLATSTQLANYLRDEIQRGRWGTRMPGVIRLARELGVARNSVEAALRQLEKDGLLRPRGQGRGREIVTDGHGAGAQQLRVGILAYEPADRTAPDTLELLHELEEAGHAPLIASKTMAEMGHRADRVARLVEQTELDAWVVFAGSRPVLTWFAESSLPVFAYAGRARRLAIASMVPDKITPLRQALRRLVELGHRRVVFLVREERRKPEPGFAERAFLEELQALGIPTGSYNLPDWEETIDGFHAGLDELFRVTPPTALIVDEMPFVVATLQFCLRRGIRIPDDLSLMCGDPNPAFDWCQPSVAHIAWDHRPILRRIVRWANNVSKGREDRRKSYSTAKFVEGGTIGPARS